MFYYQVNSGQTHFVPRSTPTSPLLHRPSLFLHSPSFFYFASGNCLLCLILFPLLMLVKGLRANAVNVRGFKALQMSAHFFKAVQTSLAFDKSSGSRTSLCFIFTRPCCCCYHDILSDLELDSSFPQSSKLNLCIYKKGDE